MAFYTWEYHSIDNILCFLSAFSASLRFKKGAKLSYDVDYEENNEK